MNILLKDEDTFFIKNCYFYCKNDFWQRSPWNYIKYYASRHIKYEDVLYSDEIISKNLYKFVNYVKSIYNITPTKLENNLPNIIIINRRGERNIDNLLPEIKSVLSEFKLLCSFRIIYLEDLEYKEQIKIFVDNPIIISPHGSGLINAIWTTNTNIIEIYFDKSDNTMYKRICDITKNKIYQVDYNNTIDFLNKNIKSILEKVSIRQSGGMKYILKYILKKTN